MEIKIYYCPWTRSDGVSSHDLLRRVIEKHTDGTGDPLCRGCKKAAEGFSVCSDGKYSKPYVKEFPDVHFSITHAGGYWACAVGDCEVGLDLQEERGRDTDRIARRFFHPSEVEWLTEHSENEFFRIWAAKESYVKFIGKGLSEGMDWFSVIDGLPACQREIPFLDGYRMVLTTEREADPCLEEMNVLTAAEAEKKNT